jgi:hypothetical protein
MELIITRAHQLCSHSIVSQQFIELECLLSRPRELSTCTYSELDQSSPHHPILYLKDPTQCYPTIYILIFLVGSFPLAFLLVTYTRASSPHSCHKPRKPHLPRLDNYSYTWRRAQITQLLVMQFSPPSRHFIPLRYKISPQRPVSVERAMKFPSFIQTNKLRGPWSASELYRLSDRHLSAKFSANICGKRGVAWSAGRIPYGR